MSKKRIDHAAIANGRLRVAAPWLASAGTSDLGQLANIIAAHVEAALALAEQAKAANLLTLLKPDDPREYDTWPTIAAALGIGDDHE